MEVPEFGASEPNGQTENTNPEPVGQESAPEDLASPFLAKIPSQDRAIVSRYVKDWDAQVTQKFQEYSSKLKPWEQLGMPPEEVQKHLSVAQALRQNPQQVFKLMWENFQQTQGDNFQSFLFDTLGLSQEEGEQLMNEYGDDGQGFEENFEDPNEVFQQNVTSELEELRNWKQQFEQSQQEAEQMAQLDSFMEELHNKSGIDFDDEWVLQRIAQHGDAQRALKEWTQMISKHSSQVQKRTAPKIPGGQGGVPANQVDVNKLRGKDRKQAVAALLEAGLQQ